MKIGLIQTQRLGDLFIVLPIAQWFIRHGHEVFWPIQMDYLTPMLQADPAVNYLPISDIGDMMDYFHNRPKKMLEDIGCDHIFSLYTHLAELVDVRLESSLKFDEYKYALTGVPFYEKWNLRVARDQRRELDLYNSLGITGDYIVVHSQGSIHSVEVELPPSWLDRYQVITIDKRTDNPLDWLLVIERASKRVMLDSMFANLTEQLYFVGDNYLIQRSVVAATPVFRNGWHFCYPNEPIGERPAWARENLPKRESIA